MNYNPSPRAEMLKSPERIKSHHTFVEDDTLRQHLNITMMEMQRRSASVDATNFNQCAAAHLRMLGAQEFVDTFLNLAETSVAEVRKDTGNLPGNVPTAPRRN